MMDQRTRAEGGTFEAPTLRIILFGARAQREFKVHRSLRTRRL